MRYWMLACSLREVDLAERILRDAGRLQQGLVERQILGAGLVRDRLLRERIGRGADARLDALACDLELLRRER